MTLRSKFRWLACVVPLLGWMSGCIMAGNGSYAAYEPTYVTGYGAYGYATMNAPGTVYYAGGYYGGVYYRPGYYASNAPFVTVYGQPSAYSAPVAQPVQTGTVVIQPGGMVLQGSGVIAQPIR
ncbi:MAG: hypothetical protein Q8Q09_23155 [Deltaproteobacteria bacterium]|nr:hypothetical protein [Deltaproteobacteria bacterium]